MEDAAIDASATDLFQAQREAQQRVAAQGLKLSVVVPIFNNGEYLRTRAFPSLVKLRQFKRLHILLIDDGSTYAPTREAVGELAATYPNVQAFFLPRGGSGSASRARNCGIDLSFTPYTGFLDPDDEFLEQGLEPLLQALQSDPQTPLAIGHQLRIYQDRTVSVPNGDHYRHRRIPGGHAAHPRWGAGPDVISTAAFRPTNLAALVLDTAWLKNTGFRQVEGAAGQDSLFFLQVFTAAEQFLDVPVITYAYHAENPGSMVNSADAIYFSKCLIRMRAQAQWLEESGLMQNYLRNGFENDMVWAIRKYRQVPEEQRAEAAAFMHSIAELFVNTRQHHWRYPEAMAFFRRPGIPSLEGVKPLAAHARRTVLNRAESIRREGLPGLRRRR